ncbi:hypothetical protein [Aquibium oceanicum]|uniref:Uncharacterized protein n=1 Tax=Aquibium oceanicum TaxID=1670800 RepID=A0A1L3SMZ2_9HYPH|nr:hypothetical protein [Aquibium oceanicum]APH70682.1 hypothetical protein BSQ44_04230 [Aquibium oceanicum]
MPRAWHAGKLQSREISDADLEAAFDAVPLKLRPKTIAYLREAAVTERPLSRAVPTAAELARDVTSIDWPGIVSDRIGH